MATTVYDEVKVIDTDTHVIEPVDLWTSRISVQKWGTQVPHVRTDETSGEDFWYFGDERVSGAPGLLANSYFGAYPPAHPKNMSEAHPSTWDRAARVAKMDELGIHAQVLYPNVAGFGAGKFSQMKDPDLMLLCVEAYNDFLIDFSNSAPGRFIPIMALPFWDVELTVKEIQRAATLGHKGINLSGEPESWGMPLLSSKHWDPIWTVSQDLDLPVHFHIASGDITPPTGPPEHGPRANLASSGLLYFVANSATLAQVIAGGVCHRFPRLKFVSVESGIGWLPFALDTLDFNWKYCGVTEEHPEYDLLPSEYFHRQMYATFWYETVPALQAIEALGPDNLLYSTDFPHPTAMAKGPSEVAQEPRDYVTSALGDVEDSVLRSLLNGNATKLYQLS